MIMKKQLTSITLTFILAFVVIITKINGERAMQNLERSSSEIYDARLLAESYVYQLSDLFYKKKITLLSFDTMKHSAQDKSEIQKQTSDIIEVIGKYSLTKLTESESAVFSTLKENVTLVKLAETKLLSQQTNNTEELIKYCEQSFNQLNLLSTIQVSEANLLNESTKKVLASLQLTAQLEWAIYLIILLLVISILRHGKAFKEVLPKHQLIKT